MQLLSLCRDVFTVLSLLVYVVTGSRLYGQEDWSHTVILPTGEQVIELFNGRDLTGWEGVEKYFSVADGQIRAANEEPVAGSTFLFTKQRFRNFRLLLEVKQTMGEKYSTMHSAVALLGERKADAGEGYAFKGPILMFCHDWGIWDANGRDRIFYPSQKRLVPVDDAPWEKKGDWNQLEILVVGNRIRMVANGKVAIDYTDKPSTLKNSPIGLQLHGNKRPQEFHFRGLILVESPVDQLLTVKEW